MKKVDEIHVLFSANGSTFRVMGVEELLMNNKFYLRDTSGAGQSRH